MLNGPTTLFRRRSAGGRAPRRAARSAGPRRTDVGPVTRLRGTGRRESFAMERGAGGGAGERTPSTAHRGRFKPPSPGAASRVCRTRVSRSAGSSSECVEYTVYTRDGSRWGAAAAVFLKSHPRTGHTFILDSHTIPYPHHLIADFGLSAHHATEQHQRQKGRTPGNSPRGGVDCDCN